MRSRPSPITAPRSLRFRNCCDAGHEPTHASPRVQNRDTIMTNDEKLEVLGRFATAGNIRSLLGTKLLVNRQTGDLTYQESGLKTWWSRTKDDSLTRPENYRVVTQVFDVARGERNQLRTTDAVKSKVERILWAFKGYSTLVRRGYGNNRELIREVKKISRICEDLVFFPYCHCLSQSSLLPEGHEGVCWAFVLDWLRRGFKGKNDYRNARRMNSKMEAIKALQKDQMDIKNRQGHFLITKDVPIVDPNTPYPNQAAYQGRNAPAAGNAAQRLSPRFDGILYRAPMPFFIAPAEQRCYGLNNRKPGTEGPNFLGKQILQYIKTDFIKSGYDGDRDRGWLLSLNYRDYFTDTATSGHAVGFRLLPSKALAEYFEPNFGTGEMDVNYADHWINATILRNSLYYAVESVTVQRVSMS